MKLASGEFQNPHGSGFLGIFLPVSMSSAGSVFKNHVFFFAEQSAGTARDWPA